MEILALFLGLSIGVSVTITASFITFRALEALENVVEFKMDLVGFLAFSVLFIAWLLAGAVVCGFILNLFGVK